MDGFSEAWIGFFGVGIGALTAALTTWLTNKAAFKQAALQLNHQESVERKRISRERLEELYLLVCKWQSNVFANFLNLRLLFTQAIDLSQFLDTPIKGDDSKFDLDRLEMILGIYAESLSGDHLRVSNARDAVHQIFAEHRAAYKRGDLDGAERLPKLQVAQLALNASLDRLKHAIAALARSEQPFIAEELGKKKS